MAHTVNFTMKDYTKIYDDSRVLLHADDLTFGNLEAPVADNIPLSTYPRFNMHKPYLDAAIQGGFDVFSLANNHATDQGTAGIHATLSSFASCGSEVFSSGLRNTFSESLKPLVITKNGWKVLFLSVTEILNSSDESGKLVYYIPPTEKERSVFLDEIKRLRTEYACDLFVLAIHLNETEYVRTVSESKKKWFSLLAGAGVDIVWGHHPHVMQEWKTETVIDGDTSRPVLFMYSMGNYISGQRSNPEIEKPGAFREYTGDSVLLQVSLMRSGSSGYEKMIVTPVLVTNYTDPLYGPVVRLFDQRFIDLLPSALKPYFLSRSKLMHAYLPLLPLEPVVSIIKE